MSKGDPVTIQHKGKLLVLATAATVAFLFSEEGGGDKAHEKVYADQIARGIPTACGGLTNATSPYPVIVGEVWSREKCDDAMGYVARNEQMTLLKCVKVSISQNTLTALTSHSHNFGVPNTCASKAVGLINLGRLKEGCEALARTPSGDPVWSFVWNGKYNADGTKTMVYYESLQKRRLRVAALCVKPDAA